MNSKRLKDAEAELAWKNLKKDFDSIRRDFETLQKDYERSLRGPINLDALKKNLRFKYLQKVFIVDSDGTTTITQKPQKKTLWQKIKGWFK